MRKWRDFNETVGNDRVRTLSMLVMMEYRTSFHQQVSDILKSNYQPHVCKTYHMILNSSQYQFVEIEHPGFK